MTTATEIKLTDEQQAAIETLCRLDRDVQTFGGLAGTGKSTIIAELHRRLPDFAVCAYTGKAANVLRRKGLSDACTIHSLIYRPETDADGNVVEPVTFVLRPSHSLFVGGVIVDEASMVSAEIYRDLKSLDLPLIFVGDHGQLEPVGAGDFNLMREPQLKLETIHRNAGEIARFAGHLRGGGDAKEWYTKRTYDEVYNDGGVSVITGQQLADNDHLTSADQIVCAYNNIRIQINNAVREHLGLPAGEPVVGDRIICLQNDREHGLFNGMQGRLTEVEKYRLSFEDEDGRAFRKIRYNQSAFGARSTAREFGMVPFDWAYCVTCHKMQGSEADNVLVLEQKCGLWSHARWAYTAASRAKRKLTWVLEG